MAKSRDELMEMRKQMMAQMEQKLHESWSSEEDSLFYYHPSENYNPGIIAIPYQGILNLGADQGTCGSGDGSLIRLSFTHPNSSKGIDW